MARNKRFRDITGQRFGNYTVVSHIIGQHWLCRCDCGTEKEHVTDNLILGKVKMCRACRDKARLIDLTGKRFGKWTVIKHVAKSRWVCRCDCGTESVCLGGNLKNGGSTKCERCRLEVAHTPKHGHCPGSLKSPTYAVWASVKQRCTNLGSATAASYGDVGIKMCQAWRDSFEAFLASMGERPSQHYSIDRANKDETTRHYSCGQCDECKESGWSFHCRWATKSEQMKNRKPRKSKLFTYNGKTMSLKDWSVETGVPLSTLSLRLSRYGWTVERTLSTPRRSYY